MQQIGSGNPCGCHCRTRCALCGLENKEFALSIIPQKLRGHRMHDGTPRSCHALGSTIEQMQRRLRRAVRLRRCLHAGGAQRSGGPLKASYWFYDAPDTPVGHSPGRGGGRRSKRSADRTLAIYRRTWASAWPVEFSNVAGFRIFHLAAQCRQSMRARHSSLSRDSHEWACMGSGSRAENTCFAYGGSTAWPKQ